MPLLVLAVDMPHMTPGFLLSMLEACGEGARGLVFETETGLEPLCAVYPPDALALLRDQIQGGNHRMQDAVAALVAAGLMQTRRLRACEVPLFFNANTPEAYAWTKPAPPASS